MLQVRSTAATTAFTMTPIVVEPEEQTGEEQTVQQQLSSEAAHLPTIVLIFSGRVEQADGACKFN